MDDDRQQQPGADGTGDAEDGTRPLPPSGADASGAEDAEDRTRPIPPPDAGVPGPGGGEQPGPVRPAPWSGRAGVPPPRPAGYREPEWYAEEDQDGRRWWAPIAFGIVALLLLGVLGTGIWLITSAGKETGPAGPRSSPNVTRTSATTVAPTSARVTTSPPSTPPTTGTVPAGVPMPPLIGLPQAAAQLVLDGLGLGYQLELQESDRPPGTVIATDPEPGQLVPPGQDVTLVIAERAAPTTGGGDPGQSGTPTR